MRRRNSGPSSIGALAASSRSAAKAVPRSAPGFQSNARPARCGKGAGHAPPCYTEPLDLPRVGLASAGRAALVEYRGRPACCCFHILLHASPGRPSTTEPILPELSRAAIASRGGLAAARRPMIARWISSTRWNSEPTRRLRPAPDRIRCWLCCRRPASGWCRAFRIRSAFSPAEWTDASVLRTATGRGGARQRVAEGGRGTDRSAAGLQLMADHAAARIGAVGPKIGRTR